MSASAQPSGSSPVDFGRQSGNDTGRRAIIDIGTNSVKMLVGDIIAGTIHPLLETNEQTRLGRGFYTSHILQADAIEATAIAVSRFAMQARELGVGPIRVIATSAVRDAQNADVLLTSIRAKCGLAVEVITGEREADLAFRGVTLNTGLGIDPALVLDVGGGSTEFIVGEGASCLFRRSYPLGAVRMLEGFALPDPPGLEARQRALSETVAFLGREVLPSVRTIIANARPRFLVGTGGSATILARVSRQLLRFDREAIEAVRLKRSEVAREVSRLWSATLRERQAVPGLPPERADIIITGAVIYEAVMETFELDELRVSTRGLRFAALLEFP